MGLLDRFGRGRGRGRGGPPAAAGAPTGQGATRADADHLRQGSTARGGAQGGVEGYIEPRTTTTESTLVLVAADGEWTRRRVPGPAAARDLCRSLGVPVYDVAATGYPARKREWDARQRAERRGR